MMTGTLRSRLWMGYILLTVLILGAFLLGLIYILNGSTILYRDAVANLQQSKEALIAGAILPDDINAETIQKYLTESSLEDSPRVVIVSNTGSTLFDTAQAVSGNLRWIRVAALKRVATQNSSGLIRDDQKRVWIYVSSRIPASQNLLVVASLKKNVTLKFMVSDPMVRLVFRVVLWAMFVSLILTLLMDRWIAKPIRKMAQEATTLTLEDGKQLSVEGIKEVKDLALAFNTMSRKVQESRQSQRDFVSDVSHELKTPLTSIQGFSAAIIDGTASTPSEVIHSAEVIAAESQRMLGMVNELLVLARLEAKVEEIDFQLTDTSKLLEGVIDRMKFNADKNKVEISLNCSSLPMIMVDPDKVTQVFLNLVENGIKFTPEGGRVMISCESSGTEIRIMVSDTGTGIAPGELPKVFNRFYQIDKSRKGGAGKSSGLGLTIAREIVKLHNGDLTVTSSLGRGTTFTVFLPLTKLSSTK